MNKLIFLNSSLFSYPLCNQKAKLSIIMQQNVWKCIFRFYHRYSESIFSYLWNFTFKKSYLKYMRFSKAYVICFFNSSQFFYSSNQVFVSKIRYLVIKYWEYKILKNLVWNSNLVKERIFKLSNFLKKKSFFFLNLSTI